MSGIAHLLSVRPTMIIPALCNLFGRLARRPGCRPISALLAFAVLSAAASPAHAGITDVVNDAFGAFNGVLVKVLFFDLLFFSDANLPLAVAWLIAGAIFFTVRMGFINVRAFRHAIHVVRGYYDNPEDK